MTRPGGTPRLLRMSGIEAESFQEADETVTFDHGQVDLVGVSSSLAGRRRQSSVTGS
jgi:hypothetical protein